MTTVACHQPDLLPYTGFWHKMATADTFVLLPYDQFQKHGYQRRVMMRSKWCSHRLVGRPSLVPIVDVEVYGDWADHLLRVIIGRYQGSPYWAERAPDLLDRIEVLNPPTSGLADINVALIRMMRPLLGIVTPMRLADPAVTSHGAERVLDHVLNAGGTRYLSGPGAAAYMPDAATTFAARGVTLAWSTHQRPSDDSILTAYFDYADPMEAVMR